MYLQRFTVVHSLMKDYFFKPPINKISLNFLERPLEKAYHSSYKEEVHTQHTRAPRVQRFQPSPMIFTLHATLIFIYTIFLAGVATLT